MGASKFRRVLLMTIVGVVAITASDAAAQDQSQSWVRTAIQAMGGENVLRNVRLISFKGMLHRNALDQSTRPEGPWGLSYFQINEVRDFDHDARRLETSGRGAFQLDSDAWSPITTVIVADGVAAISRQGKQQAFLSPGINGVSDAEESLALDPVGVLLHALTAADLRAEPEITLHGFKHHVVSFTWKSRSMRLFLNGYSNTLTAAEITTARSGDTTLGPWGDVSRRITFENWALEPGGLHYPRLFSYEMNGQPEQSLTITQLRINPDVPDDTFAIQDDVRQRSNANGIKDIELTPLGRPGQSAVELAPGIVLVLGGWNVAEIRQDDGIVIIEGPISSGYSAKVIADAENRFPGQHVKAVVTTSDSWPHIGGLREYVARSIPVYALDLNRPILERFVAAPHRVHPDALAAHPRQAVFHFVSNRTVVGKGANRIEIIPYREITGERQMMIYFPASKILYTSDLFQQLGDSSWFTPEYVSEAVDAVHREKLEVETVFGMHYGPTPWPSILDALQKALVPKPKADPTPQI